MITVPSTTLTTSSASASQSAIDALVGPLAALDVSADTLATIEARTQAIGRELFAGLGDVRPKFWQRRWWDEKLMSWSMSDEQLKVQLFRFVDVLPMLTTADSVTTHLAEYLEPVQDRLPQAARVALGMARRMPPLRAAVAKAARLSAMDFARRFIAGETAEQVLRTAEQERTLGRSFTLDILGEAVTSEVEANRYFEAYLKLLGDTSKVAAAWEAHPRVDNDDRGPTPRVNLSVKLSALDCRFDPIDPEGTFRRAGDKLRTIFHEARRLGAFINVDMESYAKKDLTLDIFQRLLMEPELRDWTDCGIVLQCYLRDTPRDVVELRNWAAERGTPVWVRLVKGAYWDYETLHARANHWPIPVYQEKWQSDAVYESVTRFVLQNRQFLRPALGSHNLRSIAHGIAATEVLGIDPAGLEMQMLYGMADAEKQALVDRGHRLRIYMPYGELIPGMAYLVRRLLENTANTSFLRAGFIEHKPIESLLARPTSHLKLVGASAASTSPDKEKRPMSATFANQPPVDFADSHQRAAMLDALTNVREKLGRHFPLVIGGRKLDTQERITSTDPSLRTRIVGTTASASAEQAREAVAAAVQAMDAWHTSGAESRAKVLRKAAEIMRSRLMELSAIEVYECGKTWREATADVDEAIDFLEFYATGAIKLQQTRGVDVPGEENRFEYLPRGVTAVIAPWNFPLAILCGMTSAAIAVGNTVVMKPAEQSSIIAGVFMEILEQAGLPAGVVNFLPGLGEVAGAALVEHPDVAAIIFTGSREVGLAINARAAETSRKSRVGVKRVIAEMGGKNAIIVDSDADLDEAVAGIVHSAFGFQGQKCSACSRAIVLSSVYDQLLARLVEATRSLPIGPSEEPSTAIGPVIDDESRERIERYIEIGKTEGRTLLATDVSQLVERGAFVGPHIFADVSPQARIAQEEIFGPVLAVIRAADLSEAIQIANSTDYALTGGIFSRSPHSLERARREMQVGNLYLNRAITGAMVGRQPFGGYKMSGIGSKAGGEEYLLQLVVPRTVTEHTVRRGFAPPE